MQKLNIDELKSVLHYNEDTGEFHWKAHKYCVKPGDKAGTTDASGYIKITLNYKSHLAHRLAWFYVHGKFPEAEIDHINRNRSDNRIANLRLAQRFQNSQNQGKKKNASGFPGVTWHSQRNKWRSEIRIDGRKKHLGLFDSICEAKEAYEKAKALHHPFFMSA